MTFAALTPLGLAVVGDAQSANRAAWFGIPLLLLAALAWRGSKRGIGANGTLRQIFAQKNLIFAIYLFLLSSVLTMHGDFFGIKVCSNIALHRVAWQEEAERVRETAAENLIFCEGKMGCHRIPSPEPGEYKDFSFQPESGENRVSFNWRNAVGDLRLASAEMNTKGDVFLYALHSDANLNEIRRCVYRSNAPR